MSQLSTGALMGMGFDKFGEDYSIEATFHSLSVYQIRGIVAESEFLRQSDQLRKITTDVSLSIGSSINNICNTLTGEDWVENEQEWKKEKNANPPYLMVLTNLPASAKCESGFIKQEESKLITYGCFAEEKVKLSKFEKEKAFPIITALSAVLSKDDHIVTFHPIEKIVYGLTADNKQLYDILMTCHAEGYTSKVFQMSEITDGIESAFQVGEKLHYKVGYFFDLATKEQDYLKKFLYYFLVLEVLKFRV